MLLTALPVPFEEWKLTHFTSLQLPGFAFFHCGNPNYESRAEYWILIGVWPACLVTKSEPCSTWMTDRSTETHSKLKKRHHAFWEALYSQPGSPETFRCSGYSGTWTSAYLFMVRELCASKARKLGQGCKPGNNPKVLHLVFVWTRKIPKQPAHTLLSLHVTEPLGRVSRAQWGWHRSACVVECFSECFTFGLVSEAQQHLIRLNTTCL